jgi:hypothetical protein
LEEKPEIELKVNSACRNSSILPLENEAQIKSNTASFSAASIKKMKFKTSKTLEKATSKVKKIELTINESCQAKTDNASSSLKIQQKIVFENTKTGELVDFETDTIINNQKLDPAKIAEKKINYQDYILSLTQINFKKASRFFNQKK